MAAVKAAVAAGTHVLPRADVTLKAPIRDVEKIICIGMNYVDHCTEQVGARRFVCTHTHTHTHTNALCTQHGTLRLWTAQPF